MLYKSVLYCNEDNESRIYQLIEITHFIFWHQCFPYVFFMLILNECMPPYSQQPVLIVQMCNFPLDTSISAQKMSPSLIFKFK